jgi:hypothetical protein
MKVVVGKFNTGQNCEDVIFDIDIPANEWVTMSGEEKDKHLLEAFWGCGFIDLWHEIVEDEEK